MPDDRRYLDKQIQSAQAQAKSMRTQAEMELRRAEQYDPEEQEGRHRFHNQQAEILMHKAEEAEGAIPELESQKAQTENRISELRAQREALEREHVEKITAIDKELDSLQGGLSL